MLNEFKKRTINIKGKLLSLEKKRIMGIINATPDSFYDGGKYDGLEKILKGTEQLLEEGADFIDIGGYSSRPGAEDISVDEELGRIIKPISEMKKKFPEAIISVDTFRAKVAAEALAAGADMINDISGGNADPDIIKVVAENKAPYIIMHIQGTPQTMQKAPVYEDVVKEVMQYFAERTEVLHKEGILDIIIDPGFGFGKTIEHNYKILSGLNMFSFLGFPVLVGLSNKSMVYKVLKIKPTESLNGTSVLNTIALLKGADIIRVHEVKEAKEVVRLVEEMESAEN